MDVAGGAGSIVKVQFSSADVTAGDLVTRAANSVRARRVDTAPAHQRYALTIAKSWPGHVNMGKLTPMYYFM